MSWMGEAWVLYCGLVAAGWLVCLVIAILCKVLPQDKPTVRSYCDPDDDNIL